MIIPQSIVLSGLTVYLDAGKTSSYPGTGTTWYDISGNVKNGTLTNGPTYSSANGGSIVFDGSTNYVLLPTNIYTQNNTSFSFSMWFKSTQSNGGTILGQQDTPNPLSATGYVPAIYLKSDGKIRVEGFWTGSISNSITSTGSCNNNNWYQITYTYGSGTGSLYINGVLNGTISGLTQTSYTSTYYYIIGGGYAAGRSLGTYLFNGNISQFNFYNRSLSLSEVLQNYNAFKGRYI